MLRSIVLAYARCKSCITVERENVQQRIGYAFVTDNMSFYVTALRHFYMSAAYHVLLRFLLSFSLCLLLYFQVNAALKMPSLPLQLLSRNISASIIRLSTFKYILKSYSKATFIEGQFLLMPYYICYACVYSYYIVHKISIRYKRIQYQQFAISRQHKKLSVSRGAATAVVTFVNRHQNHI